MNVINLLVFGNVLIALAAGFLTLSFSKLIGIDNYLLYGLMLFFGTLFTYNIQRLFRFKEIIESKSPRHQWIKNNKRIQYFILFFAGLGAMITFLYLVDNIKSLTLLLVIALVSLIYAFRINIKKRTFRELPYIKIHVIAISWMFLAFVWPIVNSKIPFTMDNIRTCIAVYFYFIGITIPFDIRDLPYDLKNQKTIPQVLGIKKSKILAFALLIMSAFLIVYTFKEALYNPFIYIAYGSQLTLLNKVSINSKELLFTGAIDGSILFFGLFLFFQ